MKLAEDLRRAVLQAAIEGNLTGGSREGWRFVRLEECASIIMGQSPKGEFINNSDGMEFHQGKIFFGDKVIQDSKLRTSTAPKIAPADSVLLSVRAPVGKVNITDREICIGRGLTAIKGYDGIPNEFIYYLLQTLEQTFIAKSTGTTFKAITSATIHNQIIPLPSLEEQRRIVSRLDVILPLIAELESAENELEALERKFPGDMRESLLQAAIEGRLTGSNTNNWRFVRLGEIVAKTIKRGKSPKYVPHSNTLVFAQKCNTKQGNIDLSLALYLDESTIGKYPEEEFMIDGDIVLNSTGRGTLGRVGQYRITDNPQNISLVPDSHVTIIRLMKDISSEYIFYVLKNYQAYIETLGEGSTNQTELSAKKVANLLIPLPPLDEQHKIVERLNELLPLCEAMKGE